MKSETLNGLGVALITPFKQDYTIDFPALEDLIEHVLIGGADYLVVLGTTAETPTLTPDEKRQIARFVVDKVEGKVPLAIGIGGNDTFSVVKEMNSRDFNGYSAILSVCPFYNRPSQEGLFMHFKTLADASPLPILLYNVPGRTGVNLAPATIARLADYSSKFVAVKEASGNREQWNEIFKLKPDNFQVVSGNDSDTFDIMKAGGCGVISVMANAFPAEIKKLVDLCAGKDYENAQDYQNGLKPYIAHLFEDGNPAGVKAMLNVLQISENVLRLPLVSVSENMEARLRHDTLELLGLE